ncbi:N-acetyltransferase family protein [Neiella sp. HB171785]|uniref:N-acetyltransferase family protein n=1 Tax=Neiella litorisoli TaxID=2771431 RepID=A0A8J6UDQ3_9GAMM|nr:arsinothricin resistance N-acetyltransferase ArsN1 family B [Neiella litorisoli]MBD1388319.1 N-acetyltransferase family protein [Neiella litorisoli]
MIRTATNNDANAIAAIYNHYIENTVVTFEEQLVDEAQMAERIQRVQQQGLPWLVATIDDKVVGYAYATQWKERSAYRYSVESTVYLDRSYHGKGLGTELYQALIEHLKPLGFNSVIGGVTLPNPASVALHEKLGMEKVAHFKDVGLKFGQWLDVGYWQRTLHTEGDRQNGTENGR